MREASVRESRAIDDEASHGLHPRLVCVAILLRMPDRRTLLHLALTTALVAPAAAQTTTAVPCALDNTLYENANGDFSNALGESVFVGVTAQGRIRRALVRFDVANALPAGARVVAVRLEMNVVASGAQAPTTMHAHRVLAPWGEGSSYALTGGGGQGAPSTTGDATWVHSSWPNVTWSLPGGDFAAPASLAASLPVTGAATGFANGLGAADVQAWVDQPATNFGWLLKAEVETLQASRARRLDSRQSAGAPPQLHVTWLLPGAIGTWGTGCDAGSGAFELAFSAPTIGGAPVDLLHQRAPANGIGVVVFALELEAAGSPFPPACSLYLPANGAWILGPLVLCDAVGDGAVAWPVPTGYPGLFFTTQTVALDAAAPLGLTLSNAAVAVIL